MVQFPAFEVEEWMDQWETKASHNLAETCCDSITVAELLSLSPDGGASLLGKPKSSGTGAASASSAAAASASSSSSSMRLTYGAIRGSEELRQRIAALYPDADVGADDVLVTQGAIGANFLTLLSLCPPQEAASASAQARSTSDPISRGADDGVRRRNVVCVHPTYQQLYEVPRSMGADVRLWKLTPDDDGWRHDLDHLASLLDVDTSLLVLNDPNNPTGRVLSARQLEAILSLVVERAHPECVVLCDEVYRPLYHACTDESAETQRVRTQPAKSDDDSVASKALQAIPSILDVARRTGFRRVISTGSLSKAWSLAGLRLGWIVTPDAALLERLASQRHYNVISVSMLDDRLASHALSPTSREWLLRRNLELARTNRALLSEWIEATKAREQTETTTKKTMRRVAWTSPQAGTTALLKLGGTEFDDEAFCTELIKRTGVLLVPAGRCFGQRGYVRIGYCCGTDELRAGLSVLGDFLRDYRAAA